MAWNELPPKEAELKTASWDSEPPSSLELGVREKPNFASLAGHEMMKFLKPEADKLPNDPIEIAKTIGEQGLNALSLGHAPQVEALARYPLNDKSLVDLKNEQIQAIAKRETENPDSAKLGRGLGMAGAMVALPVAKAVEGAGVLGNAARAGLSAGAYGAASNPGDDSKSFEASNFPERFKNAAMALGLTGGISAVTSPEMMKLAREKANELAVKSLKPTLGQIRKLDNSGRLQSTGEELLDRGMIKPWSTPNSISNKVEAAKEEVGSKYGGLIKGAQEAADSQVSAGTAPDMGWNKNSPKGNIEVPDQVLGAGGFENTGSVTKSPFQVLEKQKPFTISGKDMADKIRQTGDYKAMLSPNGTPIAGSEGAILNINKYLESLENAGSLNIEQAYKYKKGIDDVLFKNKSVPELAGSDQGLMDIRTGLRNSVEDMAEQTGTTTGKEIRDTGKSYGNLETADDILTRGKAANVVNRGISLTDTISGVTAGSAAGPLVGMAVGGANKIGRTFGAPAMSYGYDKYSRFLKNNPSLNAIISKNPQAMPVFINMMEGKRSDPKDNRDFFLEGNGGAPSP
jgi:hypothetical protein